MIFEEITNNAKLMPVEQIDTITRIISSYYSKNLPALTKACKLTATFYILYSLFKKIYKGYYGPLSKVPGPFLTRFITIPRFICDMPIGTKFKYYRDMHNKYGEIVRLGPKLISVADKGLIKQVLQVDDLPKGAVYDTYKRSGESIFSTRDKVFHKHIRRLVSPVFSVKYVTSLEPLMKMVLKSLLNRINQQIDSTKTEDGYGKLDIWNLLHMYSIDVIGETAFGESFHMVEAQEHPLPRIILKRMRVAAYTSVFPLLLKYLIKMTKSTMVHKLLNDLYEKRINSNVKRHDILQYLIDTQEKENPEDRLSTQAIKNEILTFFIAGSDTISNSVGFVIVELLRNPNKLKRLCNELDTISITEADGLFNHDQLKSLPYLNAVINESLRLHPMSGTFERCTPNDYNLCGKVVLPKNTEIICSVYHAQFNEKYWPNSENFIPERWIPGEDEHCLDNHFDAFFSFSSGSRNCIGKQFALQEMRILLATLFKKFELVSIPEEMESSKNVKQLITTSLATSSFYVKIKPRA